MFDKHSRHGKNYEREYFVMGKTNTKKMVINYLNR